MGRFYFQDPAALSGALAQVQHQAGARPATQDQLIPVDVYQEGDAVVIEGALPGARLDDLEITCDEGLLTMRGSIASQDRDFAVREIPWGTFSRSLVLPADCRAQDASASYQDGILRITIPRARPRAARTIRIETGTEPAAGSRIVMDRRETDGDQVVDAVKGQDYREINSKKRRRPGPAR